MAEKTILVIEDDAQVRALLSKMLTNNDYDVQEASDGLAGLWKLESSRPDLIILDVMMPEVDGLTFVKALKNRKETRGIPCIFVTAKSDPMSMIEGINVGAKFYITKPFQMDDVLSKVRKVLSERSHRLQ